MKLNKICEIEDFAASELLQIFREFLPKPLAAPESWPSGNEDRKFWEIGMALLAVRRCIPEAQRIRALGVGAGTEATSFVLTTLFKEVFATDRYGGRAWTSDAPGLMLAKPERFAGRVSFLPKRLVVQYMDARDLRYEDGVFDFIYSSSSLEHFGSRADISKSVVEMARVLRPGGLLSISTELRLSGDKEWLGSDTFLFDSASIDELIVQPSRCELVDVPSFEVSANTQATTVRFRDALIDLQNSTDRMEQIWSTYPHIIICDEELSWTSIHLCLRKT